MAQWPAMTRKRQRRRAKDRNRQSLEALSQLRTEQWRYALGPLPTRERIQILEDLETWYRAARQTKNRGKREKNLASVCELMWAPDPDWGRVEAWDRAHCGSALVFELPRVLRASWPISPATLRHLARVETQIRRLRNDLVIRNRRLAGKLAAQRAAISTLEAEDYFNEATFGLLTAVDHFDPNRGLSFATYAIWWVRATIHRHHQTEGGGPIRIPVHMQDKAYALRAYVEEHPSATDGEIASALQLTERQLGQLRRSGRRWPCASLDQPLLGGGKKPPGSSPLVECIATDGGRSLEERAAQEDLVQAIREALDKAVDAGPLSEREGEILRLRFGLGTERLPTRVEIGQRIGISAERTRQLEVKAIEKLRRNASLRSCARDLFGKDVPPSSRAAGG